VEEIRRDSEAAIQELIKLGKERIGKFSGEYLKPIHWEAGAGMKLYLCDRCGTRMVEKNCKVTCPNCGNHFDCSDLNIYFD
jgi:rubrerythrin